MPFNVFKAPEGFQGVGAKPPEGVATLLAQYHPNVGKLHVRERFLLFFTTAGYRYKHHDGGAATSKKAIYIFMGKLPVYKIMDRL